MTTPPPPMPPPARPGWWTRNWKWAVPVAAVSMVSLIVGFIGLICFGIFGMMKSSQPCKEAFAKAVASPQVQAELGTPIHEGLFVSGNISTATSTGSHGASGSATMSIPISGPKASGTLSLEATQSAGVWTYSTLEVAIDGKSEKINLKP